MLGAYRPEGRYSTLAGFVEVGEPLEMAVAREVEVRRKWSGLSESGCFDHHAVVHI